MPKEVWPDRSKIRRRKLERTKKRKQQECRTHLDAETRLQRRQQSADGNLNTAKTCTQKKDVRETRITGYRESEEEKIEKSTAQTELQCRGLRHAIRYRTADYYRNNWLSTPFFTESSRCRVVSGCYALNPCNIVRIRSFPGWNREGALPLCAGIASSSWSLHAEALERNGRKTKKKNTNKSV